MTEHDDDRPVEAFRNLSPSTKRWLRELREEDIKTLRRAMQFYSSANTIGKFLRWAGLTALIALGAGATFGDHIANLWRFMGGKPP